MSGAAWEAYAVRYGTRAASRREFFYRWDTYGEPDAPLGMDYFFWVLRRGEEAVLVDTGFDPEIAARTGRTTLTTPEEALAVLGIDPASIRLVLITHMHYDHIGNLRRFPGAKVVVAARELEFWSGPLAARRQFAAHVVSEEVAYLAAAAREGRARLIDAADEPVDGVRLLRVGGHSPGQLLVRVATADGELVLTSDALHYYQEIEHDRPCAVLVDLADCYRALDVARDLEAGGATLVAGHDPLVCERFARVDAAGAGSIHRLS